ncbi:Phytochrome-like protein cph1 [Stieleria varia]|uniref:histidine kinase n=2 Tax=Stieleria varia TaxID=2528005 RepID=A0A5C6AG23_9BACT|nr:Phytochrome-like protein cph1 [Stieleria varia]
MRTDQSDQSDQKTRFAIPIRWKLLATTAAIGLVAALIAISGLSRMQALNDRMNRIVDVAAAKSKLASLTKQELVAATRAEKNMILAKSQEEMERHMNTIDRTLDELQKNETALRALVSDETREQLDQFRSKWDQWQFNHAELRQMTRLNSDVTARMLSVGDARNQIDALEGQLVLIGSQSDDPEVQRMVFELSLSALKLQRFEKNLILASTAEAVDDFSEHVRPLRLSISEGLQRLAEISDARFDEQITAAQMALDKYIALTESIRNYMGDSGDFLVFQLAYGVGEPLADESEELLNAIIDSSEMEMTELQTESGKAYRTARNGLIVLSAIGIAVGVLISFVIGGRIANDLGKLAAYAQAVHDARDLSRPIPVVGNDEVGQVAKAFDGMRKTVYAQNAEMASLNSALVDKSQEMEQFVYTVSHDLKSPLVSCKGLLGLLKEDLEDEAYDDVIDSANRLEAATDQLSRIIDDLLELSRIGRKPLELVEVNVHALMTQLVQDLTERLEVAGVSISVAANLPAIRADESDLRRAFDNLITNAIKYAADVQDPKIEVGGLQSKHAVRYFVRDNGPGIEPGYQEKIFGLFQRLDNKKEGTGLGLASVRKIARMHGGRAWVESKPTEGATFWIEIPVKV